MTVWSIDQSNHALHLWGQCWGMRFNENKCNIINLGKIVYNISISTEQCFSRGFITCQILGCDINEDLSSPVWSHLDYSTSIWDPHLKQDMNDLKKSNERQHAGQEVNMASSSWRTLTRPQVAASGEPAPWPVPYPTLQNPQRALIHPAWLLT